VAIATDTGRAELGGRPNVTIAQAEIHNLGRRDAKKALGLDFYEAMSNWRLWTVLGWTDIRRRYRRSVLGPFWLTISMSLLIAALGALYSRIFNTDIATYLPYLTVGFVVWGFIATSIKESCVTFWHNSDLIKQIKIPFSAHILRLIWANFIVLLHTIVIIVPIWIYFHEWPTPYALMAIPGVLIIGLNLMWVGVILAILNTRFRDVSQMVETALQIAVFATPIMWPVSALGERKFVADVNPIYHLIELVRAPLLGEAPNALSWLVALGSAGVGLLLAALLLRRVERRIVYWL
jgi:ABC-type polysaccharide/polyol phosphate export permease